MNDDESHSTEISTTHQAYSSNKESHHDELEEKLIRSDAHSPLTQLLSILGDEEFVKMN